MRTILEDTNLKAELEDTAGKNQGGKYTLLALWFLALVFLAGTWTIYRWVDNRPAVQPPPPPVSLDDPKQTSEAFGKFNRAVRDENWAEAENMLSTAAKERLSGEQKNLGDSLKGDLKNYRISEAATTQSIDRSVPGRVRQDSYYVFTDANYLTVDRIIPLVLVMENGRLVIDSWSDVKPEEQKKTGGENKPAEKK
jgi:hypothetical protein